MKCSEVFCCFGSLPLARLDFRIPWFFLANEFPFSLTYLNLPRLGLQTIESGCERHSNFLKKDIEIRSLHDMEAYPWNKILIFEKLLNYGLKKKKTEGRGYYIPISQFHCMWLQHDNTPHAHPLPSQLADVLLALRKESRDKLKRTQTATFGFNVFFSFQTCGYTDFLFLLVSMKTEYFKRQITSGTGRYWRWKRRCHFKLLWQTKSSGGWK